MRRLVLLLGIVAAAAGVWVMFAFGSVEPPPGLDPEAEATTEDAGTLTAALAERESTADVTEAASDRVAVDAGDAVATGKAVRVLVTRRDTGEPVPGAQVSYSENFSVTDLDEDAQAEYRTLSSDREKLTERYGANAVTDQLGVAFVPIESYVRAAGRLGPLYGEVNIRRNDNQPLLEEYRLVLERDLSLQVQVLDARGQPAVGVPLGILPQYQGHGPNSSVREIGKTEGPEGRADITHLQKVLQGWAQQAPVPDAYLLRANIPGMTEGRLIDPEDPPAEPIVLQLPPTGTVTVEIRDAAGERLSAELIRTAVSISPAPDEPIEDNTRFRAPNDQRWRGSFGSDDVAVFERVVVGEQYIAVATPAHNNVQKVFPGPLAEGQEILVTIPFTSGPYILVGRALDEGSRPMSDVRVRIDFRIKEGMSGGGFSDQSDEEGIFKIVIPTGGRDEVTLTELTVITSSEVESFSWKGERSLAIGENDLGDVLLRPGSLVAAGRILVDGSTPTGNRFSLYAQELSSRQRAGTTTASWSSASDLRLKYLDDGRFELRGEPAQARYRILQADRTYLPLAPVEFAPGTTDLLIELESGGALEADLLLDANIPLEDLLFELIPLEGQDLNAEPDPDTRFSPVDRRNDRLVARPGNTGSGRTVRWNALWPGRYRFEARARGARAPLITVDDVRITTGETTRDSRMDPIDLRGKLRTITITVVDPDRELLDPTSDRSVVVINDRNAEELEGFGNRVNPASILMSEPYLDLLVVARGYRPKEINGVRADTEVMLEPFPHIVVKTARGFIVPDGHTLRATVRKVQDSTQRESRRVVYSNGSTGLAALIRAPTTTVDFEDNGEIALQVDGNGRYLLRVSVRNDATRRSVTIKSIEPGEIEVNAALGQQVFEIRIPDEGLRQAVERAGRR